MPNQYLKELLTELIKPAWDNCPNDFCIAYDNLPKSIVFGSTNRVRWTLQQGFRIDKPYCTVKFYEHYKTVIFE